MTIAIKHAFVSLKGDGTDNTQVQPSNWNALHSFTLATGNVVGRLSAGAGAAEEIPISAYFATLMGVADVNALATKIGLFETGDVKYTFKTAPSTGWIIVNNGGSIGDATSGASIRANADTFPLFSLLYTALSDTQAPLNNGGRTGNALADFNAHKAMTLPALAGRSPVGAGTVAGSGITAWTLGGVYGEQAHALLVSEIPAINSIQNSVTTTSHPNGGGGAAVTGGSISSFGAGGGAAASPVSNSGSWSRVTDFQSDPFNINVASQGTFGNAHNNMHPVVALNPMVKL